VKAAGNGPKTICSGFSTDKKKLEYCEQKVEEQCMNPVKKMCEELNPKKDGDAYKKCASEAQSSWERPQDEALKKALESQAKKFVVDFRDHDGVRQTFSASNMNECSKTVKDVVDNYGAPKPPDSNPTPKETPRSQPAIIAPDLPPQPSPGRPHVVGHGHPRRPSAPVNMKPPMPPPPIMVADATPAPDAKADPHAEARKKLEVIKRRAAEARARLEAGKKQPGKTPSDPLTEARARLALIKARAQKARERLEEAKRRAAEARREEVQPPTKQRDPIPAIEPPKGTPTPPIEPSTRPALPPVVPPVPPTVPSPPLPDKPKPDAEPPKVSAADLVKIRAAEAKSAREELALARKKLVEAEKAEALARKEARKLGKVKARLAKVERVEEKKEPAAGKAIDTSAREAMMKRESEREEKLARVALAKELRARKEQELKAKIEEAKKAKLEAAAKAKEERAAKAREAKEAVEARKATAAADKAAREQAARDAEAAKKAKAVPGTKVAVVTGIERPSVTSTVPTPEIVPVTLTPENFNDVIINSRRPVIIAVTDQVHRRSVDIVQGLIKEQASLKDPSSKAAIAILDVGNKQTRQHLWERLVNLRKDFGPVMINKNQIKPCAIFRYEGRSLKFYTTETGVGVDTPDWGEPRIPRLTRGTYLEKLKYGSFKYPLAIYVVRDPADGGFVGESMQDAREKFYINWSDSDDRAFATQVLGIPPLSDDQAYVVYESKEPDKYGFMHELSLSSIKPQSTPGLIDRSTLTEDPFEFVYLDNNDYERYFGGNNSEDALVVVGDPLSASTQKLVQRIVDEKRQLSSKNRLFVIPYSKAHKSTEIIERLKLPVRKNTGLPQVFEVKRSEGGGHVIKPFKPRGFERVHAGNNLWQEIDKKETQDVLVVIGDDNRGTNAAVAEATHKVQKHLIERSGIITVEGRKQEVKRMVFVSYGEALRLLRHYSGGVIEDAIHAKASKGLPQMYLMTGRGKKRGGVEITPKEIGLPDDFAAAPMRFGQEIYKPGSSTETPMDREKLRRQAALKEKGGVAHVFTETRIGNRRWDTFSRFVIVIGKKDDPRVQKAMAEVVRKETAESERRTLFLLDATIPAGLRFEEKVAYSHAFLRELEKIGVPSYKSGGVAVFSCARDSLRKAPECKPYPLTNGK